MFTYSAAEVYYLEGDKLLSVAYQSYQLSTCTFYFTKPKLFSKAIETVRIGFTIPPKKNQNDIIQTAQIFAGCNLLWKPGAINFSLTTGKLIDQIMSDGSIKTQTVYQISPATSRRTTSRIYPVGALDIFSGDIFRFRVISPFPSLLQYISLLFSIC